MDDNTSPRASVKYRSLSQGPASTYIKYIFDVVLQKTNILRVSDLLTEIKTGKTPSKSNALFYEGKLVLDWFKPEDVGKEMYLGTSTDKLSEFCLSTKSATIFNKDTLLITCIGDIGRIGLLRKQSSSNQQITGILFNEKKILPEFTYFYFLSHRGLLEENKVSTTLPIINQKKLLDLSIPVPIIQIQQKLIKIFNLCVKSQESKVVPANNEDFEDYFYEKCFSIFNKFYGIDILLNKISPLSELTNKLKQSILQDAIQGKLVSQDPKDEPAEKLLEKIKEEKEKLIKEGKSRKEQPLPLISENEIPFELPEGWKWCRLGDLTSQLGDGLHGTPDYTENGDYFFINGNNLDDGKITIKGGTKRVSINEYNKFQKTLNDRTVFVSINGTIGNVAFYNNEKVILGKSACYFNLLNGINKFYLKIVIKSKYFLDYAMKSATGTTIKNVSLKSMRMFLVPVPSTNEQKRIVEKVEELLSLCDKQEKNIVETKENINKLNQAILREMFN